MNLNAWKNLKHLPIPLNEGFSFNMIYSMYTFPIKLES